LTWTQKSNAALDCTGPASSCLDGGPNCQQMFGGQCSWDSVAEAKASCGLWEECEGIYCSNQYSSDGKLLCFARGHSSVTKGIQKSRSSVDTVYLKSATPAPFVPRCPSWVLCCNIAKCDATFPHQPKCQDRCCASFITDRKVCRNCRNEYCGTIPTPAPTPKSTCTGSSANLTYAQCKTWQEELYTPTGGEQWSRCSNSKLDPCSCCSPGFCSVTCEGPDIVDISLQASDLRGQLGDLSAFTKLRKLRLFNNALTGTIPASLGKLPALNFVALYANQLSGTVPHLPWAQYTSGCVLDGVGGGPPPNQFACPLPNGASRCIYGASISPGTVGVSCK